MSFVFASLRAFWNWDILESGQTDAALAVAGILLNAFFIAFAECKILRLFIKQSDCQDYVGSGTHT